MNVSERVTLGLLLPVDSFRVELRLFEPWKTDEIFLRTSLNSCVGSVGWRRGGTIKLQQSGKIVTKSAKTRWSS